MKDVGLVGMPRSGKTTLFNALTGARVPPGGAAGKATVAAVTVPDPRVGVLAELERSRKRVGVQARFVDIAGLEVAGKAAGVSAQALANLREGDALAFVLGAFAPDADPLAEAAELMLTLAVADLASIEGGADKAARRARAGVKEAALEAATLGRARDLLDAGAQLRSTTWEPQELAVLRNFAPLTLKPVLAILNVGEDALTRSGELLAAVEDALDVPAVAVAGVLEAEAAELPADEARTLLTAYGVEHGGLDQVVGAAWRLLDLLTFFTTGEDETRAWELKRGATAPEAAGRIHSDLQRGFIRAEVVGYDQLVAAGGWEAARGQGLLRSEGKSYVVVEGDCIHVRFNV